MSALLGLLLIGCGDDAMQEDGARAPQATPVAAWRVEPLELEWGRSWGGVIEPLRAHPVASPVSGEVERVLAREGAVVRAGDSLFVVRVTGMEDRLAPLRDRAMQLDDELERWERLAASGAAGPGEVAEARLRALEVRESLSDLEATVRSGVVRAPVPGRIQGVEVVRGGIVAAGNPLLVLEEGDRWTFRVRVPAAEAAFFERPEALRIRDDRGELDLTPERVTWTEDADRGVLVVDVHLRGDPPTGRRAAVLTLRTGVEPLVVPWTAVATDGDEHWVARISGEDPGTVERRGVRLGRAFPEGIEVISGLESGDLVVRFEPRTHPEGRAVEPLVARPGGER